MAAGNWTLFQKGLGKWATGLIDLDSHAFKIALTSSGQPLTNTFVGASGDCRYADLTAELATGSGYTSGGQLLSSVTLSQLGSTLTWSAANASWALSGSLVFKYVVIYDDTTLNKDLFCFALADYSGGSVTATLSPLVVQLTAILGISG